MKSYFYHKYTHDDGNIDKEDYVSFKKNDTQTDFLNFIKSTIIGTNRGFYRNLSTQLDSFKDPVIFNILCLNYLKDYFNKGYRALIYSTDGPLKRQEDKDDYWITSFNKFVNPKQSYICALNKIMMVVKTVILKIDRSLISINNMESMDLSLKRQVDFILDKMELDDIINHLGDKCDGLDIRNCDPKDDMFNLDVKLI